MTITPNVFGIGPPRPTQDWDLIEFTDHALAGPETIDLERWSITEVEFSPGNFEPHRDVLLQSASLTNQVDLDFQNFDDGLTLNWFRLPILGVIQGTLDVWINTMYDDDAFPGILTPDPFLQVWKDGGALLGPIVMTDARVIVGPTKIGSAFYFGVVDHTSGLGQLFKTSLDLSEPGGGGAPNTAVQIGADTGSAFPNAPTTLLPTSTPSGCNNFIATDEHAAMLINNGRVSGSNEAWVFPLDGLSSPTLATVSGMSGFTSSLQNGTVRSPPGIWLPGRSLGIFKDTFRTRSYTISPTAVVFTDLSLSLSIGAGGWTVLPDEIRLLAEGNLGGDSTWENSSFNLVDIDTNTETLNTGRHFTDATRTTKAPVAGNQSLWVPHSDL